MSDELIGKVVTIALKSQAGWTHIKVTILGVTTKRYRVRLEQNAFMPWCGHVKAGDVTMVPRNGVRLEVDSE